MIFKFSKKSKIVIFLIFSGILKCLIMVGFKIPSKNAKNKKTRFLKKLHLQCVFYNLENYVLSQGVSFFCVFLDFDLPSTSNTDFCVFLKNVSFPLWKKAHKSHFSRDFLHSSITVRFWNCRNFVLTPFEEKTLLFEPLLFEFVEQRGASFFVFSKGDTNPFLKNDFFTLKNEIPQNVKNFPKTLFSARMGGCASHKKNRNRISQCDSETPKWESQRYLRFEKS